MIKILTLLLVISGCGNSGGEKTQKITDNNIVNLIQDEDLSKIVGERKNSLELASLLKSFIKNYSDEEMAILELERRLKIVCHQGICHFQRKK